MAKDNRPHTLHKDVIRQRATGSVIVPSEESTDFGNRLRHILDYFFDNLEYVVAFFVSIFLIFVLLY